MISLKSYLTCVISRQNPHIFRAKNKVGSGNRFTQAYTNLRRDGVQFRGSAHGGGSSGGSGGGRSRGPGGGQFRSVGGRTLQPGDEGYDEEADLAAAIFESTIGAADGGVQGSGARAGGGLASSAGTLALGGGGSGVGGGGGSYSLFIMCDEFLYSCFLVEGTKLEIIRGGLFGRCIVCCCVLGRVGSIAQE